jgi:hypothetical protein
MFPSKVFHEWRPIAQALSRYLNSLGATPNEAEVIIDRLQVKWMLYALPLTRPALYQTHSLPPRELDYTNNVGIKFHAREMPRNRSLDSERSLFELAKLDYNQSKIR